MVATIDFVFSAYSAGSRTFHWMLKVEFNVKSAGRGSVKWRVEGRAILLIQARESRGENRK